MARYTCSFTIATPLETLHASLIEVLEYCGLDVIYNTGDYLMARESPGNVSFSQLVAVEVLVDKALTESDEVRLNVVVKNEELPLQVNNHCKQVFDLLQEAIAESRQWQLLEKVGG